MPEKTLFEAIGGAEYILRLAHAWHERVMADDIVAHAFSHGFHPQPFFDFRTRSVDALKTTGWRSFSHLRPF